MRSTGWAPHCALKDYVAQSYGLRPLPVGNYKSALVTKPATNNLENVGFNVKRRQFANLPLSIDFVESNVHIGAVRANVEALVQTAYPR